MTQSVNLSVDAIILAEDFPRNNLQHLLILGWRTSAPHVKVMDFCQKKSCQKKAHGSIGNELATVMLSLDSCTHQHAAAQTSRILMFILASSRY